MHFKIVIQCVHFKRAALYGKEPCSCNLIMSASVLIANIK